PTQQLSRKSSTDADFAHARCQARPANGDAAMERSRSRSHAAASRASASVRGIQAAGLPVVGGSIPLPARLGVIVRTLKTPCRGWAATPGALCRCVDATIGLSGGLLAPPADPTPAARPRHIRCKGRGRNRATFRTGGTAYVLRSVGSNWCITVVTVIAAYVLT